VGRHDTVSRKLSVRREILFKQTTRNKEPGIGVSQKSVRSRTRVRRRESRKRLRQQPETKHSMESLTLSDPQKEEKSSRFGRSEKGEGNE